MEARVLPEYKIVEAHQHQGTTYWIVHRSDLAAVPENLRSTFQKKSEATHTEGQNTTIFLQLSKAKTTTISSDAFVKIDATVENNEHDHYLGHVSDFLSSAYKFSRKAKKSDAPLIYLDSSVPKVHRVVSLAETRNKTREWANGRGDVQGTPQFFKKLAEEFSQAHGVQLTVFSGEELLKQGFRLMHAVGRGSQNEPVFINLAYKGNPNSDEWTSFVGKGVCFDTGGYNMKPTSSIKDMFLDKHGAVSVFTAFQTVVLEKLPVNLTCTMGYVQNFVSHNAYRPMDIITSRKGLTVEIGNTDAEGRLVLADCMNWVQQKYKPKVLIELSTLTGAMIFALGSEFAGVFTNSHDLFKKLKKAGSRVNEKVWEMPCTQHHKKLVSPKHCDLTNSSGKSEAGSSQAAAFLKSFVEEGVNWAHIDIAGTSMGASEATGWGARILVEYIHSVASPVVVATE